MWLVAGCRAFPVVRLRGRVSVARVAVVGGGQSRPPSLHAAVAPMLSRSAPADKPRLCVSPSSPRPAIPQGAGRKGKKSPAPCRFFLLFFRALAAARNSGYTEPSPFRTPVRSTHTLAVLTARLLCRTMLGCEWRGAQFSSDLVPSELGEADS